MKNNKGVQVTLPHSWRTALRAIAKEAGTTPNKLILDAIEKTYGEALK
jgi:hypothetical protein